MTDLSPSCLLRAGETRVDGAMLPFKLLASDSAGAQSICEFTLPGWASGPVLHRHVAEDEHFFAEQFAYLAGVDEPDSEVLDEIGRRFGAPTVGPPIVASQAPSSP